jgi:glycosyltransferase involved in cell wall biosynthesis
MLIDSTFFNGNEQHPEIYKDYKCSFIEGFPTDEQVILWLEGLDVVITCEIFYNMRFVDIANKMGVKTINQYNWEFADYLRVPTLTRPTILVSPSKWNLERAKNLWGNVEYLPTPVFVDDFAKVRETNMSRVFGQTRPRFLHIMGRQAMNDRNGTNDLLRAMRYSNDDFELVIKHQSGQIDNSILWDDRVTFDSSSPENEVDLYKNFDAMILPRRYAGQCLPMTEALCAGLPVIMTDVSPNNEILPQFWCVPSHLTGRFMARTWVDMYTVNHAELGQKLDVLARKDLRSDKIKAYNIGYSEYSDKVLKEKWEKLIEDTLRR